MRKPNTLQMGGILLEDKQHPNHDKTYLNHDMQPNAKGTYTCDLDSEASITPFTEEKSSRTKPAPITWDTSILDSILKDKTDDAKTDDSFSELRSGPVRWATLFHLEMHLRTIADPQEQLDYINALPTNILKDMLTNFSHSYNLFSLESLFNKIDTSFNNNQQSAIKNRIFDILLENQAEGLISVMTTLGGQSWYLMDSYKDRVIEFFPDKAKEVNRIYNDASELTSKQLYSRYRKYSLKRQKKATQPFLHKAIKAVMNDNTHNTQAIHDLNQLYHHCTPEQQTQVKTTIYFKLTSLKNSAINSISSSFDKIKEFFRYIVSKTSPLFSDAEKDILPRACSLQKPHFEKGMFGKSKEEMERLYKDRHNSPKKQRAFDEVCGLSLPQSPTGLQ